jgi:hypothetical protein
MQNFYLINYIKENFDIEPGILDSIRYELDEHIYYYGNRFLHQKEVYKATLFEEFIKPYLKKLFIIESQRDDSGKKKILSNAYFTLNNEIDRLGCRLMVPGWSIRRHGDILFERYNYAIIEKLRRYFLTADFKDYFNSDLKEI